MPVPVSRVARELCTELSRWRGVRACVPVVAPKHRAIYAERLARKVAICNYYHRYLVRPAANRDGLIKARGLTPQTQPVSRSRAARGPSPINSECNDGR